RGPPRAPSRADSTSTRGPPPGPAGAAAAQRPSAGSVSTLLTFAALPLDRATVVPPPCPDHRTPRPREARAGTGRPPPFRPLPEGRPAPPPEEARGARARLSSTLRGGTRG